MLKKFAISLLLLLTLVGCQSANEPTELTAKSLYDKLCADIIFEGTELTYEQAASILFLDDKASEAYVYIATDNSSNIIATIKTTSTIATIDNINKYIATINQSAMNYSPQELAKIKNAYVKALNSELVVFVICDDITQVEKIIK
ncbi:MAG: DUF4358 domain-containing protein [Erysipelotrichaceae bacterium]|nr:DUF4358 domain-containing protein [Erysipelotrichaceae bacterium]MDY5251368.1 DUF4358 domain-containing protein [Erysipelotrichaceae bacterium]